MTVEINPVANFKAKTSFCFLLLKPFCWKQQLTKIFKRPLVLHAKTEA